MVNKSDSGIRTQTHLLFPSFSPSFLPSSAKHLCCFRFCLSAHCILHYPARQSSSFKPVHHLLDQASYLLKAPPELCTLSRFVQFHIWLLPAPGLNRKDTRGAVRNSGAVTRRLRHARPGAVDAIAWCTTGLLSHGD